RGRRPHHASPRRRGDRVSPAGPFAWLIGRRLRQCGRRRLSEPAMDHREQDRASLTRGRTLPRLSISVLIATIVLLPILVVSAILVTLASAVGTGVSETLGEQVMAGA